MISFKLLFLARMSGVDSDGGGVDSGNGGGCPEGTRKRQELT